MNKNQEIEILKHQLGIQKGLNLNLIDDLQVSQKENTILKSENFKLSRRLRYWINITKGV